MKHFMIDFETLSLADFPALTEVGMIEFDILTGETLDGFELLIDPMSCVAMGARMDAETLEWRMKNSGIGRLNRCFKEGDPVSFVFKHIKYFIEKKTAEDPENFRVWSNGLLNDVLWANTYFKKLHESEIPWKHWQVSDVRTLVDVGWQLLGVDHKKDTAFKGEKHMALADCEHQAKYVSLIYSHLKHNCDAVNKRAVEV